MDNHNLPAQQEQPKRKIDVLKGIISAPSIQEQFNNALKENAGIFTASIIDLYNSDTYLQNCEPKLVVTEALKAAVLKLPINKALGFSYLVPYKNKHGQFIPTFQIGYRGLIQLAMRTAQYRIINADVVYEGELKSRNKLTGEIDFAGGKTSESITGYFAYIETINGFSKTLYMTKEQVTSHARKYSASFSFANSAWQTNFDEMALKTVLRNLLSHYGFLSIEMMGAIETDLNEDARTQRDEQVSALTATKNINMDDTEFEEISGKPDQGNSISQNGTPAGSNTPINPGF
jgi:recombination protein RecT